MGWGRGDRRDGWRGMREAGGGVGSNEKTESGEGSGRTVESVDSSGRKREEPVA